MNDEILTVDCRGLACPQPVVNTKEALTRASTPFAVIVDNQGSCTNVRRFAESQGATVVVEQLGSDFRLTVAPGVGVAAAEAPEISCHSTAATDTVVFVASETMGHGDDRLGTVLMTAFLDTLSHFKGEISHAIFVNGGVRLTVDGSPAVDQIRQLEELGANVLVCGTCLDFFGIREELAVGSVSNMYAIIEALNGAGRVIRP